MSIDTDTLIKQFIDYLMPELSPHEASLYLFLLRHSHLEDGSPRVRIGQRSIAQIYGRGPKMATASRAHILRQIKELQKKGCLRVFDVNREGTLYEVILPMLIPSVIAKIEVPTEAIEDDYYNDPAKRRELFQRDNWICFYCGERVTEDNVTLDHFEPRCKDGSNTKENLKTSCLICNSIKAGKTYDEAIPLLYKNIQERARQRNHC